MKLYKAKAPYQPKFITKDGENKKDAQLSLLYTKIQSQKQSNSCQTLPLSTAVIPDKIKALQTQFKQNHSMRTDLRNSTVEKVESKNTKEDDTSIREPTTASASLLYSLSNQQFTPQVTSCRRCEHYESKLRILQEQLTNQNENSLKTIQDMLKPKTLHETIQEGTQLFIHKQLETQVQTTSHQIDMLHSHLNRLSESNKNIITVAHKYEHQYVGQAGSYLQKIQDLQNEVDQLRNSETRLQERIKGLGELQLNLQQENIQLRNKLENILGKQVLHREVQTETQHGSTQSIGNNPLTQRVDRLNQYSDNILARAKQIQ